MTGGFKAGGLGRETLVACALVVLALLLAFRALWLHGDSLVAALASPGITQHGPVGGKGGHLPVADGVAAYIDEPQAYLASRQLAEGRLPLWNPHNALGVPLLGNWQSSVLNPLRWLVQLAPSPWMFDFTYLLRLLVAGIGAVLLARHLGASGIGAAAAGIAFALTGYFVRHLQMHHLNGEVVLPWLLLAADRLGQERSAFRCLATCAAVFATVTGGNPQPILIAGLTAAVFAATRLRRWGLRGAAWVLAAALPAVLLAAPYWLAGLEYVSVAEHHHKDQFRFGQDAYTAAGALGFFLPQPYAMAGWLDKTAPWLGAVPLLLAVLGAGRGVGRSVLWWSLLLLLGGKLANLPGTTWLGDLPGLEQSKLFKYLYPPCALALALLAGNGVEALREGGVTFRRLCVAAGVLAVPLLGTLVAGIAAANASPKIDFAGSLDVTVRGALVAALLTCAWRRPPAQAGLAALVLLGAELVLNSPSRWLARAEPFTRPSALAKLRHEQPGSFRLFGVYGALIPNQNAVLGFDGLGVHDGVLPARFAVFARALIDPNMRHWPVLTGQDLGQAPPHTFTDGQELMRAMLPQRIAFDLLPPVKVDLTAPTPARYLDLLNVRYLVLPADLKPAVDALPAADYALAAADQDLLLVERKKALPRAFFPRRVERVVGPHEAIGKLAAESFDPREVAYLETDLEHGREAPVGFARVSERPAPHELLVSAQCDRPAWLVVSIAWYPGLRCERDDKPLDIVPCNAAMCAVPLPLGRSKLRFVYEPPWGPLAGWLLAGGAAFLLLAAFVARRRG
jgi:hypothetical protein